MKSQGRDPAQRRYHDPAFKADLIEQSLRAGASVSAIALKAGINANLLFKWRRDHVRARSATAPAPVSATLLPVCVVQDVNAGAEGRTVVPVAPAAPGAAAARSARPGVIELEIAGAQLRLRGDVDESTLSTVLRALRQTA